MNLEEWELEQLIDQRIERYFLIQQIKELCKPPEEPAMEASDSRHSER